MKLATALGTVLQTADQRQRRWANIKPDWPNECSIDPVPSMSRCTEPVLVRL